VRPVAFPPLDQVKPQLEEMMRQQEIAGLQKKLRDEAKIN
jgi:peptidyl-prolyl cis-trans isomerase C